MGRQSNVIVTTEKVLNSMKDTKTSINVPTENLANVHNKFLPVALPLIVWPHAIFNSCHITKQYMKRMQLLVRRGRSPYRGGLYALHWGRGILELYGALVAFLW